MALVFTIFFWGLASRFFDDNGTQIKKTPDSMRGLQRAPYVEAPFLRPWKYVSVVAAILCLTATIYFGVLSVEAHYRGCDSRAEATSSSALMHDRDCLGATVPLAVTFLAFYIVALFSLCVERKCEEEIASKGEAAPLVV